MFDWIASGRIVDIVIAFMALEAVGLWFYHRRTGRGIALADLWTTIASGLCLLLALRAALSGGWAGWIAIWLTASLIVHIIDLRSRWR